MHKHESNFLVMSWGVKDDINQIKFIELETLIFHSSVFDSFNDWLIANAPNVEHYSLCQELDYFTLELWFMMMMSFSRLCVFIYVCFSESRIIIFAYVSSRMISDVFCK